MRQVLHMLATAAVFIALFSPATTLAEDARGRGARPATWHAPERVFAGPPVMRTSEEIRAMRAARRPAPASDPELACYYREHIVNRCPQAARP